MFGGTLSAVDRDGLGQPENPTAPGIHNHDRVQKQPNVGAVADGAEAALAAAVAREVQFGRILDRQNVPTRRRACRMLNGGGDHLSRRYRRIVQKAAESYLPGTRAAEAPDTSRPPVSERGKEVGPPFLSRSSPNDPKSCIPRIGSPPRINLRHGITTDRTRQSA